MKSLIAIFVSLFCLSTFAGDLSSQALITCDFNAVKNRTFGEGVLSFAIDLKSPKVTVKCENGGPSDFCISGDSTGEQSTWKLKGVTNLEGNKQFSRSGKNSNLYVVEGNNQDDQELILNLTVSANSTLTKGVSTLTPSAQAYITVYEGYDNIDGNTDVANCKIEIK